MSLRVVGLLLSGLLFSPGVPAHSFGRLYTLPVPFTLYAWACAGTLIASFLLIGLLARSPASIDVSHSNREPRPRSAKPIQWLLPLVQLLSVAILALTIATALYGNRDPYRNFSMIGFWITFCLGLTYITPFIGNIYALLNPWRNLAAGIGSIWKGYQRGLVSYPKWLADWPALALYLGFIGYELLGTGKTASLGWLLAGYTTLNLVGVWVIGATAWFRHCEFFSLFYRLIGLLAPVNWQHDEANNQKLSVEFRPPLAGLWRERPGTISTVIFVLAMLSTTAFDGLSATRIWVQLFWADPYSIIEPLIGGRPMANIGEALPWYFRWQVLCLIASPFLYFAAYSLAISLAKRLTHSQRPVCELMLDFGYSLLPIALVYHATHYATLLLSDGLKILSVISDPFGHSWDIFGTAWKFRAPILPDMSLVWHSQVGLILLGHIASVYVAHRIALQRFGNSKQATKSQLPMLALMIAFTIAGLWILVQPLTIERMT